MCTRRKIHTNVSITDILLLFLLKFQSSHNLNVIPHTDQWNLKQMVALIWDIPRCPAALLLCNNSRMFVLVALGMTNLHGSSISLPVYTWFHQQFEINGRVHKKSLLQKTWKPFFFAGGFSESPMKCSQNHLSSGSNLGPPWFPHRRMMSPQHPWCLKH